jgi:regulator of protease activity HflC (stomatin/prohibitin superfamily)
MDPITEKNAIKINGYAGLAAILGMMGLGIYLVHHGASGGSVGLMTAGAIIGLLGVVFLRGLFAVQPNDSRVQTFLGSYTGSIRVQGFWMANPLASRKRISLRVRNFNCEKAKVNDALGNPIEIAAVVVWRVEDNAKASFDVDDYEEFVSIQSETAIRSLASRFPYDASDEETPSLRGSPDLVASTLQQEVEARLDIAGVHVLEARISHLAYAPEIAQAMLRRQQAHAIIAARKQIVEGAVGMVEAALTRLSEQKIVELDEERKATMVNNLLVVLTSESETQPVINTGTLYG